jgi:hypothetical protein
LNVVTWKLREFSLHISMAPKSSDEVSHADFGELVSARLQIGVPGEVRCSRFRRRISYDFQRLSESYTRKKHLAVHIRHLRLGK